jgi:hypothetical protein
MGFLDWLKQGRQARGAVSDEKHEPDKTPGQPKITAHWLPQAYKDRASGYLAQAQVGHSEKGYHAGLLVVTPNGERTMQWSEALPSNQRAYYEAHSAFGGWVESHEAAVDAGQIPVQNIKKSAKGNQIRIIGEWRSNGLASHEFKHYVGRSIEGYHGGFEAAPVGADGVVQWSNARPTVKAAVKACRGMSDAWERNHEHKLSGGRGVSWDR